MTAVKTNAYREGAAKSESTLTNPARLLNYTQIARQSYFVSDTERAVNTAAFNDRYSYEAQKALKMLKNDMELAILSGSMLCGSASVTGQCQGIKNWLSLTCGQSGMTFNESRFNEFLQSVWNAGTEVNAAYVPMVIKARIASWVGSATNKNVSVTDKRLVNSVSVYEADAARMVKIFPHRHINQGVTTGFNDVVLINEDLFRVAYLRKPWDRQFGKAGDSTDGEVGAEFTLECLHQHGGIRGKDLY